MGLGTHWRATINKTVERQHSGLSLIVSLFVFSLYGAVALLRGTLHVAFFLLSALLRTFFRYSSAHSIAKLYVERPSMSSYFHLHYGIRPLQVHMCVRATFFASYSSPETVWSFSFFDIPAPCLEETSAGGALSTLSVRAQCARASANGVLLSRRRKRVGGKEKRLWSMMAAT